MQQDQHQLTTVEESSFPLTQNKQTVEITKSQEQIPFKKIEGLLS